MAPKGKFKKNLNCHSSGCMQDRVVIFGSRVGFSGTAYLTASSKFTPDDPRCHGNEIWDKIGYNSACIRDTLRCLRLIGGFRGRVIEWCQSNITTTDLGCHGNEIWDKIAYNSSYIRDIPEMRHWFSGSGY